MTCSHALSICVLNTPRRYLTANTRWSCRLPATLRPRRVLGSVSRLGVGGHRYVACYEVPPVSERHAGSAPVGAVWLRPVRVEPRPGAAPDVAALERTHAGLGRPGRAADRGQGCGAVACLRVADGSAAGVARPRPGMAAVLQWHPQAPEVA